MKKQSCQRWRLCFFTPSPLMAHAAPAHTPPVIPHSSPCVRKYILHILKALLLQALVDAAGSVQPRLVIIEAQCHSPELGIQLQQLMHRLTGHTVQRHITVMLPALRVQADVREQINGSLEDERRMEIRILGGNESCTPGHCPPR